MKEPKGCPFCGGKAKFITTVGRLLSSHACFMFYIKCDKCGIGSPKTYECDICIGNDGVIQISKDERLKAIEDWNRRTNDETD